MKEIEKRPFKLYSFVNCYLSDLQKGLQTAHLVANLFEKYQYSSAGAALTLSNWAHYDKTIIILNGGNSKSLEDIYNIVEKENSGYPYDRFYEDQDSLNGALTCVGLVFPEFTKQDIENYADVADGIDNFIDLMRMISNCRLA